MPGGFRLSDYVVDTGTAAKKADRAPLPGRLETFEGVLYDMATLWRLSARLPVAEVAAIHVKAVLGHATWGRGVSPKKVVGHPEKFPAEYARILRADTRYPILALEVDDGMPFVVIDGVHRLARLILVEGAPTVRVRYVSGRMFLRAAVPPTAAPGGPKKRGAPADRARLAFPSTVAAAGGFRGRRASGRTN